jgi:TolB-like protein/thioredoxin-like negative regulator of GroEL
MQIWSAEIKELESLYTSLKGRFPELEKELEQLIETKDANVVMLYSRRCLEIIVTDLCEYELKRPRKTEPLKGIIDKLHREEKVPSHIITSMESLNSLSTYGTHPKEFDPEQVRPILLNLATIIKWYVKYKDIQIISQTKQEKAKYESKIPVDTTIDIRQQKKKLIFLLSGFLLFVVIVVAVLFVFNVIGGKKKIKELEKSIAVLPFDNMSVGEEYLHIGDAITDEIILELQKINEFDRVLSRTSTMQYKDNKPTIPEIAEKLGVNYLIEGSIQRYKEDVKIRVQVIRAKNEDHIWGNEYNGKWEDIFYIQDQIAFKVANELKTVLSPKEIEKIEEKPTENPKAYNLYLKGRYFWNYRTEETLLKAIDFFEQAIAQDSNYALAYSGLADSYSMLPWYAPPSNPEYFLKAKQAALKALEKDNSLAEAHTSLGYVNNNEWKFETAEKEYLKAIELDPEYSTVHHWYAMLLACTGHFDQAIDEILKACNQDPLSLITNLNLGAIFTSARQYDNAIEALNKVIEIDPEFSTLQFDLARAYLNKGMYENALSAVQKSGSKVWEGIIYAQMGQLDKANQLLDELVMLSKTEYVSPFQLGMLYFSLDSVEKGFSCLEKAYEIHDLQITEIKMYPELAKFSSDLRLVNLLKKMGLE